MKNVALIMLSLSMMVACSDKKAESVKAVEEKAMAFAEAYYRYDLGTASQLATPEATRQLKFVASNITQDDIDLLNSQTEGPIFEVVDCQPLSDSLWRAHLSVSHYMEMDSIDGPMRLRDEGEAELTLVFRNRKWLVKSVITEGL